MSPFRSLWRTASAELIGTALLVIAVVGSGEMATSLTKDAGLQLAINAIVTVLALGARMYTFSAISGAHFNPVITASEWVLGRIKPVDASTYLASQFLGGFIGVMVANVMFSHPAISNSLHERGGTGMLIGEAIATAGLIIIVQLNRFEKRSALNFIVVPAWIGAAYFFTSSTAFANPAVTYARTWSDSFAGIAPQSVVNFMVAQLVGGAVGITFALFLHGSKSFRTSSATRAANQIKVASKVRTTVSL